MVNLERIQLLINQRRYDIAEGELRQQIGQTGEHPVLYAYLGIALMGQEKMKEAKTEVKRAIGMAPDMPLGHNLLGRILLHEGELRASEIAFEEAIRLDPSDADPYLQVANLHFYKNRYQKALKMVEQALAQDPESVDALNLRARLLIKLGRSPEASDAFEASMNKDPENSRTHTSRGWSLLEEGRYQDALEHFREALRIDANNDYARKGLVEGLKARFWIYRAYLKLMFWMDKMSQGMRWGIIIGLVLVANTFPALTPYYLVLVFFTWFSSMIFNLLLFFNPYGRFALSEDQRKYSAIFGALLFGGLGFLVAGFVDDSATASNWTNVGMVLLLMMFPVTGTAGKQLPSSRKKSIWYTLGLAGLGGAFIACMFLNLPQANSLWNFYMFGTIAYTWLVNTLD